MPEMLLCDNNSVYDVIYLTIDLETSVLHVYIHGVSRIIEMRNARPWVCDDS